MYVSFFPQLVAGPIERSARLLPQFLIKHKFDYQRVTDGLKLMAWGMFKKVVIADRLSALVNQVYNDPQEYQGISLIVATVFFAFQVYCDFSAYSDIAIGGAQVMGFKLMQNFNIPFSSKSVSEFWRRWHISLSTWFGDYVYTPMVTGLRGLNKFGIVFSIMSTFLIVGLWHGANWNFIIFGFLHGSALCYELLARKTLNRISRLIPSMIYNSICLLLTFSFFCFTCIFFRADTASDAFYIVSHLFTGVGSFFLHLANYTITLNTAEIRETIQSILYNKSLQTVFWATALICFLEVIHYIQRYGSIREMLSKKPIWVRWSAYYMLVSSIIFFGVWDAQQFIYFQF